MPRRETGVWQYLQELVSKTLCLYITYSDLFSPHVSVALKRLPHQHPSNVNKGRLLLQLTMRLGLLVEVFLTLRHYMKVNG
jgi:hypothetical protein